MLIYIILLMFVVVSMFACRIKRQEQATKLDVKYYQIPIMSRHWVTVIAPAAALLFMVLLAGFREGLGTDFYSYKEIFQDFVNYGFNSRLELGFSVISYFIALTTKSSVIFYLVMAALVYIPIYFAFNRHSYYIELSIFLFIIFGFYTNSFNIMRQWIAIAIGLLGMKYVIKKQFFRFVGVVLVAMLFHKTAIILIPAYFILCMKSNDIVRFMIIIATIIAAIFIEPLFEVFSKVAISILGNNKYTNYLKPENFIDESGKWFNFPMICIVIYAVYLYQKKKGVVFNRSMNVFINYIILGFFFIGIGQLNSLAGRVSYYFLPAFCIVIPNLIYNMKNSKIIIPLLLIGGVVYFTFTLPIAYHPYVSIFGG